MIKHKTITPQGYAVTKEQLTQEEIKNIKHDLSVKPITMPFLKNLGIQESEGFNVYLESKRRYWLPKYYGIEKFGNYVESTIHEGEKINTVFNAPLREHQLKPYKKLVNYTKSEGGGILSLPCGFGKCLGYNTPVLLYDGSIKMVQDITKHDLLMGDDSKPRKILSICTGKEKLYKIKQNYGIDYVVNESHILTLGHSRKGIVDIPLKDYLNEKNKKFYYALKASIDYNYFFCNFSYPYVIGMFYVLSKEIKEPLIHYTKGSQKTRREFLAGIIDYVKEIKQTDCYGLYFENYEILETTKEIANSLGYGIKQEENTLFIYAHNIVTMIKEKIYTTKHLESNIEIEELMVGDFYGFVVDGNRRFLLGDCTVTHNTAIAIKTITELKKKALVIVHKEFLMDQWKESIQKFTDASVGIIQQNKLELDNDICIAMIHSLCLKDYPKGTFDSFGTTVVDECHHLGSEMFSKVLLICGTKYRIGLSATPTRRDGLQCVYNMHIGPVIHKEKRTKNNNLCIKQVILDSNSHYYKTLYYNDEKTKNNSKMVTNITLCPQRNKFIVDLLLQLNREKRKTLLLSSRREHLHTIKDLLNENNFTSVGFYYGNKSMSKKEYKNMLFTSSKCEIILATEQLAKEGLDIPDLDTLVMTTSISEIGALEQSIGRILRKFYDNTMLCPTIIDIVDKKCGNFGRHASQRKKFYKEEEYCIEEYKFNIDQLDHDYAIEDMFSKPSSSVKSAKSAKSEEHTLEDETITHFDTCLI
jgi:superfamily II DNA or RNA helicase